MRKNLLLALLLSAITVATFVIVKESKSLKIIEETPCENISGVKADACARNLIKGQQVYVEGFFRLETWTPKKGGEARTSLRVYADQVLFLDKSGAMHDVRPPVPGHLSANDFAPRQPIPPPPPIDYSEY